MQAGQLRERVTLRDRTDAPDGLGGLSSANANERQRWAKVEPVAGLNLRQGEQVTEGATHRVTLRHDAQITSWSEVLYAGDTLRVLSVMNDPRHRYTLLDVEQITHAH